MKIFSILCFVLLLAFSLSAQRASLTKTAETVEQLQIENELLRTQVNDVETRLNNIRTDVDTILQEGKRVVKIPTTVDEAKNLYVYASSIIMFLLVGIFRDKLPKWLTPFTLSIFVGILISAIGYFSGDFTVNEIVVFLMAISGGSNLLHQVKKPKKIEVNTNILTPPLIPNL